MCPKISVIIPVYNVEKWLNSCLESACVDGDIEIICVNDGSTDSSGIILDTWKQKDERIKVIHHNKNYGLSAARNTGLTEARGKYILFLDSDDYFSSEIYDIVTQHMEKYNLDLLRFNAKMIFDSIESKRKANMSPIWWNTPQIYVPNISGKQLFIEQILNGHYRQPVFLYAIRKEYLNNINLSFYDNIYHEDELFTMQLLLKADKTAHIKDQLYVYRCRENSITTIQKNRKHFDSIVIIIDELIKSVYVVEPEILKRSILTHFCFLLKMLLRNKNLLPKDEEYTEDEKDLIYLAHCQPSWLQRNMIEKYIHKKYK